MSQAPFAVRDARFGVRLGTDLKMEDTLWAGLTDQHVKTPMGITAENLAVKYAITRFGHSLVCYRRVCLGRSLDSFPVNRRVEPKCAQL